MDRELWRQMEALQSAPIDQLRSKYRELFGEEARGRRRESLFRQVAWRMQALAEGGLSERARDRYSKRRLGTAINAIRAFRRPVQCCSASIAARRLGSRFWPTAASSM